MKKINKTLWLAALPLAFAACQDDNGLSDQNAQNGNLFTLHCTLEGNATQGRAQVQTGNNNAASELFMWNNNDKFVVYDHADIDYAATGDSPKTSIFTIDSNYDETSPAKAASFTTSTGLTEEHTITAIYPVQNGNVNNGVIQLAIPDYYNHTMTATTPQAWKEYMAERMFMVGSATVEASTSIAFHQLCAMARITYTNATEKEQTVRAIALINNEGNECFGEKGDYDFTTASFQVNYTSTFAQLQFENLTVAPGKSEDLYLLFFPGGEFAENGTLSVGMADKDNTNFATPAMPTSEISEKNGGAKKFEAGKRYWFRVMQTDAGLLWGKEQPGEGIITNLSLIEALESKYNVQFVKDKNGYVDVAASQGVIENITDIDVSNKNLDSMEGIEYFTKLGILNCSHNNLTILDISKNTELSALSCDYNNITDLNTEMNTKLSSLFCNNNRLTALNLSKNTALRNVHCEMNRIATLDIIALKDLNTLVCGNQHNVEETESMTLQLYLTNEQKEAPWFSNSMGMVGNLGIEFITPAVIANKALIAAIEESANVEFVKDANGYASIEENLALIESIEVLQLEGKGLTSLAGIEYFTKLKVLNCRDNGLTSLDVSKNTELEVLECGNNYYGPDIAEQQPFYNRYASLDVSNNTKLIHLSCDNTFLTELNVTNNTQLIYLSCSVNPLQTLDVSNNTQLEHLSCVENSLSELNLSQNTALISLECGVNKLKELDVTGLSKLTDLNCPDNQLTSLNVRQNTQLTYLECSTNQLQNLDVSQNTLLTYFQCSDNPLTEIDITNNTELTRFACETAYLTHLDVSHNTKLEHLRCCMNQLSQLDITSNPNIDFLECGHQKSQMLYLILTDAQKELWKSKWSNEYFNRNVILYGETTNTGSGNHFNSGGRY